MPRFDKTGPFGMGPMTGRGFGPCGFGGGFGFGYRRASRTDELEMTREYIEDLKEELKEAEEYLRGLES
jgi:hypothetical protein